MWNKGGGGGGKLQEGSNLIDLDVFRGSYFSPESPVILTIHTLKLLVCTLSGVSQLGPLMEESGCRKEEARIYTLQTEWMQTSQHHLLRYCDSAPGRHHKNRSVAWGTPDVCKRLSQAESTINRQNSPLPEARSVHLSQVVLNGCVEISFFPLTLAVARGNLKYRHILCSG